MFYSDFRKHLLGSILFVSLFGLVPETAFGQNAGTTVLLVKNDFVSYTEIIPESKVVFDMVAIKGGQFMMGSPDGEQGRKEDEGPLHSVKVGDFWMGKHEVTWDEFELFVFPELLKEQNKKAAAPQPKIKNIDAVTRPTPPFVDMSFGMGKTGFPAVNMTQYAALMYCRWLTTETGHFYRLPTEAEWEYACRAGTTTAYSFGNDPKELKEYAWFYDNSNNGYKKVGTKKPNQWGLHDMHGNVAEWTLDQYKPDSYAAVQAKLVEDPWVAPTALYPHVVRGGSWDDDAADLRSATRLKSDPRWKQRDPQIPRSNWWLTDAPFVGFRIVRPLKEPTRQEVDKYFAESIPDL